MMLIIFEFIIKILAIIGLGATRIVKKYPKTTCIIASLCCIASAITAISTNNVDFSTIGSLLECLSDIAEHMV